MMCDLPAQGRIGAALALTCLSAWVSPLRAQGEEERNVSAMFHSIAQESRPNVDLPAQVIAPEGRLTLFADYARADDRAVPLYVVNRSGATVTFFSQDGDLCIKLEQQKAGGAWQRAQAHQDSFCGNSYGYRSLPPGHHYQLPGYRVTKGQGTAGQVRYACYGSVAVVSNAGDGEFLEADVTAASRDDLVKREVPQPLASNLERSFLGSDPANFLTPPPRQLIAFSLDLVRELGGNGALRQKERAVAWTQQVAGKPDLSEDEKQTLHAVQAVLARPWSSEADPDRLMNHCLALLKKGDLPEGGAEVLWQTLAAPCAFPQTRPVLVSSQTWELVLEDIAQRVMTASEPEARPMLRILAAQTVRVDECLADAVIERWVPSSDLELMTVAIEALGRRGRWSRLVGLGQELPPERQVTVLKALILGQSQAQRNSRTAPGMPMDLDGYEGMRMPLEASERRFWEQCIQSQPLACAGLWQHLPDDVRRISRYSRLLHEQLMAWLDTLAAQGEAREGEFDMADEKDKARLALKVLVPGAGSSVALTIAARDARPEDTAALVKVLHRLLDYPGYILQTGTRGPDTDTALISYEERYFVLRDEAAQALRRLGQPVPPDLVTRRDVATRPADPPIDPMTRRRNHRLQQAVESGR